MNDDLMGDASPKNLSASMVQSGRKAYGPQSDSSSIKIIMTVESPEKINLEKAYYGNEFYDSKFVHVVVRQDYHERYKNYLKRRVRSPEGLYVKL